MSDSPARTAALTATAGGAGATRLAVATGAVLARTGANVAVLDAAFATQGLAQHVPGRITTDITRVITTDSAPAAARYAIAPDADAALTAYPAFAAFERIAAAKTPAAAARLGSVVDTLADAHDYVLVDTPPIAANQAVAAVTATDAVVAVVPPGDRGVDTLQRARGRLADIGTDCTHVVANRAADTPRAATHAVPTHATTSVPDTPVPLSGTGAFTAAVAALADAVFDTAVAASLSTGSVLDAVHARLT